MRSRPSSYSLLAWVGDVLDVSSAKRGYSFVGDESRKAFASLR